MPRYLDGKSRSDEPTNSGIRRTKFFRPDATRTLLVIGLVALLASGFSLAFPRSSAAMPAQSTDRGSGLTLEGGPPEPCTSYSGTVTTYPVSGPAGATYWVNGTGFYPEGYADVYWVNGTPESGIYQLIGTAALNMSGHPSYGNFSAKFALPPVGPAYLPGTYNITAEDGIDKCGSASFGLTSASSDVPQLTIEYPQSGIVGTATSVDGLYFSDSATISPITMGGDTLACSGGSPVTSPDGAFTCDFTIPETLSAGTYPVIATDPTYGPITSTNEFTDTGGQTATVVSCSPNPIGTSSSYTPAYLRASSNCTATVTDSGSEPTGTITWSSSSTTGVFFTWIFVDDEYDYSPTTTCTLNSASQCSIFYADSNPGLPTITGDYSGDYYDAAGSGTDSLLVVPITTPTVVVSCNPSFVVTSSSCTADVTGSSPTGNVSWTAGNEYTPSEGGSFATTTCTLVGGSCSVTYYGPPPYMSCSADSTDGCAAVIFIEAQYHGDALNSPADGYYWVASGSAGDQYDAYVDGVVAELPFGSTCTWCKNTSGPLGGLGVKTEGVSEHVSGTVVGPDENVLDTSDAFGVMGSAPNGEISATGTSTNEGDADGEVFIADTVTVTGQCDVSGNLDPGNLLDCLGISLSISGDVQAYCDDSHGGCVANSIAGGNFEMCDLDQPTSYGYACASGEIGGEACAGSGCTGPCPAPLGSESVCTFDGGVSLDFQSPPPVFFSPGAVISSGDSLYLSESIEGMVSASLYGSASLTIDPSFKIVNLDPSEISVSPGAAEVIAMENPSALRMMSSIAPNPVSADTPVVDTTVLTNAGTSTLTNVTAYGSMDGPLSCPDSNLTAGGHETCTGAFSPVAPGAQADVVVANGTNATDVDIANGTTAPFFVIPTLYNVTFNETGLPPGTSWSIFVNGTIENTTLDSVNVSLPYGPYSYLIIPTAGYTATPSSGSFFIFNHALSVNLTMTPGFGGPVVGAIAELYAVYDQRTDLQASFPDANSSLSSFIGLVRWAGSVVEGQQVDPAYSALAPFGAYYTLMNTYAGRPDLEASFPGAFTSLTNYTQLVEWAGGTVEGAWADNNNVTLQPFGYYYLLMNIYNGRPDLQASFPDAYTNYTNYTELVNWAGGAVEGAFVDNNNVTLEPFGFYYVLMTVYSGRPDLEASFPDAFTNFTSYSGLVLWAGGVVTGNFVDNNNVTLAPYGYWYVLVGWVYEQRSDLQASLPVAITSGTSYAGLLTWAKEVVLDDFTDPALSTLEPWASTYEALG